jgi:hypothetical protein
MNDTSRLPSVRYRHRRNYQRLMHGPIARSQPRVPTKIT